MQDYQMLQTKKSSKEEPTQDCWATVLPTHNNAGLKAKVQPAQDRGTARSSKDHAKL